jgi:ABC-type uncharacterized transport system permease subunit
MPAILLHLIPSSLYVLLAVHFWRIQQREPALPLGQAVRPHERIALFAVLGLHALILQREIFTPEGMRFGFSIALALMLWLALLFYWVENLYARLEGLQTLVLPIAALTACLPGFFPTQHLLENTSNPYFRAHFVMAMLAYSLFTLAALHAMLMAAAEKRLHNAHFSRTLIRLPPLLTMEALLFRLITVGFSLLTLTLVSGAIFSEAMFDRAFRFDHKTVFALISWDLFATLLVGRYYWGWRGRKAIRWTLAGFATLILAYIGSHFVLEVVLGRA